MSLTEFVFGVLGMPTNMQSLPIFYAMLCLLILIMVDGILTFIIGAISSLLTGGRR